MVAPAKDQDLHGNVPDNANVALIIIDMITDFLYPGGDQLRPQVLEVAHRLKELKERAKQAGVPVIYANDNYGKWQSDFSKLVEHVIGSNTPGKEVAELLRPDKEDYFVLKPKNSGFYSTALDTLLIYLNVKTLVITGQSGNSCILFTANDAYMRDYYLFIPTDCIASIEPEDNRAAIQLMQKVLHADIRPSPEINWNELQKSALP